MGTRAPHGQKTIKFTVVLWTNNLADEPGTVEPGHAWYKGMVHVVANPAHGIASQPDPIPFNEPDELDEALRKAAKKAGVILHDPRTNERMEPQQTER